EHHRFRAPDGEYCTSSVLCLWVYDPFVVERTFDLLVSYGGRATWYESVRDSHDDESPRVDELESALTVSEPALLVREVDGSARIDLDGADAHDRLAYLLTVGADVLYRRRADEPRDPRKTLDACPSPPDRCRNEL